MRLSRGLFVAAAIWSILAPAVADDSHNTVGEFLAYCSSNPDGCKNVLDSDYVQGFIVFSDHGTVCIPDNMSWDDVRASILDWLRSHPEQSGNLWDEGVDNAAKALWPCRN
ncbi:MAG: hypothetical protein KGJ78_16310 [Alphaproteobacteria bacterium]|nr:hypothetical protein [Alphaproteobacteria bacterium]